MIRAAIVAALLPGSAIADSNLSCAILSGFTLLPRETGPATGHGLFATKFQTARAFRGATDERQVKTGWAGFAGKQGKTAEYRAG